MSKILIGIIIIAVLFNMLADVLLVSGKSVVEDRNDIIAIIKNTPEKHIILCGMIGVFAIPMWTITLYFLSYLEGALGIVALISFAMFIGANVAFHVSCSNVFLLAKRSDIEVDKLKKILIFYAIPCVVFSLIYTFTMAYMGITGILEMNILHYLTLPLASTLIFQVGLGNIIKIKHFGSISGTLGILIAMLSTISIIMSNFNVL